MRRVDVFGPFDRDLARRVVKAFRAASGQPIDLRIDSIGGNAGQLVEILLEVEEHPAPVFTTVVGQACSAACVLAMAGDVRRINRGATMMAHYATPPSKAAADEMREIMRTYTLGTKEQISEWLAREKFFTATEALRFGLVDRIIDAGAPEPVRLREPRKRTPAAWLRRWRDLCEEHDLREVA